MENSRKIKERYPLDNTPWSKEMEQELKKLYNEGKSLKEIAENFKRKTGAIRSRLIKLGLLQ